MRRRNQRVPKKLFLLSRILPMRPYVCRLMADLRGHRIRQWHLQRMSKPSRGGEKEAYDRRRGRHQAMAQLEKSQDEELELLQEFNRLGIRVGNVLRGEMLFPCPVDSQWAYFVWYDSEPLPTHWRFHGESRLYPNTEPWFEQVKFDMAPDFVEEIR